MDTKSLSLRILKMCWWMMALSIFKVKIDHCLLIKTVSSQLKTIVFEAKIFHGQEMCFKGTYTETCFNSLFVLLYPQMVVQIEAKSWSGCHIVEDLKQIILLLRLFWFRGQNLLDDPFLILIFNLFNFAPDPAEGNKYEINWILFWHLSFLGNLDRHIVTIKSWNHFVQDWTLNQIYKDPTRKISCK